jgi:hypothetical protein
MTSIFASLRVMEHGLSIGVVGTAQPAAGHERAAQERS